MNFLRITGIFLITIFTLLGCKKTEQGYLSKVILYNPKTFVATKGRVTTSAALLVDGSTNPIMVKLLGIRNYYTKQPADSILLKKYEIATYKAEITQNDTTLEQINSKIGTGMYSPFNISPLGGRIEVTPASNYIDTGTYEFDIEVSNPAGKRVVNNVGIVRIVNPTNLFDITAQSVTTSPTTSETFTANSNFTTSVVRTNSTENKVIIKFVDKNGIPFNPNAGQVLPRADRPFFKIYAPFYPEAKTDTALVYQYPAGLPTFPIYPSVVVSGGTYSYVSYYRIPAAYTDINLNVNPVVGFRLWPAAGEASVKGTFIVTMKLNFVAKKP
jgi:hypothetical protein